MNGINGAWTVGFVCGLVAVIILFRLLARKLQIDGKKKTEYDERQLIERGKGYRCAFFAYVIFNLIMFIADLAFDIQAFSLGMIMICGILVAAAAHVIYCIFHEAYWGLNNNVRNYVILLVVAGGINLIIGIVNGVNGELYADGVFSYSVLNLAVAIFLIVIFIAMLIKWIRDKREVE